MLGVSEGRLLRFAGGVRWLWPLAMLHVRGVFARAPGWRHSVSDRAARGERCRSEFNSNKSSWHGKECGARVLRACVLVRVRVEGMSAKVLR